MLTYIHTRTKWYNGMKASTYFKYGIIFYVPSQSSKEILGKLCYTCSLLNQLVAFSSHR